MTIMQVRHRSYKHVCFTIACASMVGMLSVPAHSQAVSGCTPPEKRGCGHEINQCPADVEGQHCRDVITNDDGSITVKDGYCGGDENSCGCGSFYSVGTLEGCGGGLSGGGDPGGFPGFGR